MTVDYDTRRRTSESEDEPLPELAGIDGSASAIESDDDVADFELPDTDLVGEELVVRVLPQQPDEFTCASCFLVQHRSRLAPGRDCVCTDCD